MCIPADNMSALGRDWSQLRILIMTLRAGPWETIASLYAGIFGWQLNENSTQFAQTQNIRQKNTISIHMKKTREQTENYDIWCGSNNDIPASSFQYISCLFLSCLPLLILPLMALDLHRDKLLKLFRCDLKQALRDHVEDFVVRPRGTVHAEESVDDNIRKEIYFFNGKFGE